MPDTLTLIAELSDEQAIEALNLLSGQEFGDATDNELLTQITDANQVGEPEVRHSLAAATPEQVAALARLVLVVEAVSGSDERVASAIEQAGEKAIILEIAVIGLLGLGLLHHLRTGGKKTEKKQIKVEVGENGTISVTIEDEVNYYGVGEALAPLATALLKPLTG